MIPTSVSALKAAGAKTALALIAITAAMFAHAVPASAKLVWVPRAGYRIAAYVQPGRGPAIVLCHGFPDNHHLYDRVVPLLKGPRGRDLRLPRLGTVQQACPLPLHVRRPRTGPERRHPGAKPRPRRLGGTRRQRARRAQLDARPSRPGRSMILSNGFYAPVAGSGPPALAAIFALGQYPNTAHSDRFPRGPPTGSTAS